MSQAWERWAAGKPDRPPWWCYLVFGLIAGLPGGASVLATEALWVAVASGLVIGVLGMAALHLGVLRQRGDL